MIAWRPLAVVSVIIGGAILATPSAAVAAVAITVPATVDLGSGPTGANTRSVQMATVTVTASGLLLPSFIATVSSTNFTTGAGTPAQTITKASLDYWSGPVTAFTGAQTAVPGQLTALQAQPLSASLTAFSSTGLVLSITTSWIPSIVIRTPSAAVAGSYTGTITHSVA